MKSSLFSWKDVYISRMAFHVCIVLRCNGVCKREVLFVSQAHSHWMYYMHKFGYQTGHSGAFQVIISDRKYKDYVYGRS